LLKEFCPCCISATVNYLLVPGRKTANYDSRSTLRVLKADAMSPQTVTRERVQRPIAFKFAPAKARAALLWMLDQNERLDLHTVLKACYFADKTHLNEHQRPIFGATYRAMRFGPVPVEIYEMVKGEPLWLPELEADHYPWELRGHYLWRTKNEPADTSYLSKSDMRALEEGYRRSIGMKFNERTAATHGPDWQAADMGIMRYEDMLEDSPRKKKLIAYLREAGRFVRL
jgi:hypothetical protein